MIAYVRNKYSANKLKFLRNYLIKVTNKLINDGCNSDLKYLYSALIEGRLIILSLGGDKPFEFQSVKSHLN